MTGNGGLESAGSALKRMMPELVISKQRLRQAEGSCSVRLKREEGKQNVGFSSRPFVLCGLPVRKPPKDDMLYERRNGNFVLQITGHPHYGLPFGQDRIVPIYLGDVGRAAAKPDHSFPDSGGNAGNVWYAQGRQRISAAHRRLRTDLQAPPSSLAPMVSAGERR